VETLTSFSCFALQLLQLRLTPCYLYWILFFFFSSRRRHTRSYGDWSSDVCSSDLGHEESCSCELVAAGAGEPKRQSSEQADNFKIGRASCRERGEISVVAGVLKKKKLCNEGEVDG